MKDAKGLVENDLGLRHELKGEYDSMRTDRFKLGWQPLTNSNKNFVYREIINGRVNDDFRMVC